MDIGSRHRAQATRNRKRVRSSAWAWIGLFSVTGCAVEAPPASIATAPTIVRASVLAVRPIPASPAQSSAARLLGSTERPERALTEFIVRTADGRVMSVVQPADPDLAPGSEAVLSPGSRPVLTHRS